MWAELQTPPSPPTSPETPPPLFSSLQLGAHLQESGFLLHDANQQRVNVVLQISDLRLQLLQLHLPLGQQDFLTMKLRLLPLQLRLTLHQQGDQFAVGEVVVRARSFGQRLTTQREREMDGEGRRVKAMTDYRRSDVC